MIKTGSTCGALVAVVVSLACNAAAVTPGNVVAWGRNDFGQINVPAGLTNAVMVAAGFRHSVALRSDGTVAAWGRNDFGQATVPDGLDNVVAISAGAWHTMALRTNGTIVVWGDNTYGQSTIPVGLSNVVAVSGGAEHSMALRADGSIVAWGYNGHGQTSVPVDLTNVIAIAACGEHSLALRADGTVAAWGWNGYGQSSVPAGLSNVVAIAGWHQSMALQADGTVIAWGWNNYGQSAVPVGLSNVVGLAVGDFFSAALRTDGSVAAWGGNTYDETSVPVHLTNARAIAGGGYHTLAIAPSRSVVEPESLSVSVNQFSSSLMTNEAGVYSATVSGSYTETEWDFGDGSHSLNTLSTSHYWLSPGVKTVTFSVWGGAGIVTVTNTVTVTNSAPVIIVVPGEASSYTGRVVAWGRNDFGQTNVPVGLTNVIAVAGGFRHSMALRSDGTVVAWGRDDFGQATVPSGLTDVVAISAGAWHSMALRANGTIAVWGDNTYGQSDIPLGLTDVVAISGGAEHSMALRANGTVVAWGYNAHGQTTIPTGLTNVIAIAACGEHSLALRANGTVVAWGWNGYGQASVPTGLTNVIAIAGWHHSMALRSDGTVVAWGWNGYGQASVPADLTNATGLAVGDFFSAALRSDGTVITWGGNTYGETTVPVTLTNARAIAGGGYHTLAIVSDQLIDEPEDVSVTVDQFTSNLLTNEVGVYAATVSGPYSETEWDFGDGTYAWNTMSTTHAWSSSGIKTVVFTVWGGAGIVSVTNMVTVTNQAEVIVVVPGGGSSYTGSVVAWGRNDFGQTNVPAGLTNVVAVAGGFRHSMALRSDGTVVAWGHDEFGQATVPLDLTNVVAISAGAWHSMALRANGTIAVWGDNMYGQSDAPVGLTDVVAISGGAEHSMALRANGTVVAWGYNAHGQTTIPPGLTNVIAIAACGEHSLALKSDGTVVAWGWNGYGQASVPAGLSNVVAIAGWHQSMALRADGTVSAWGWNNYGQSDVPDDVSDVVGLAMGDFFSAALRSNGSVVAWGGNTYGETDVPSSVTNAFAIAGGGYHTLAIVPEQFVDEPESLSVSINQFTSSLMTNEVGIYSATISGAYTETAWDFGDGSYALNTLSATHAWSTPGITTVVFTVWSGSDVVAITNMVTVTNSAPVIVVVPGETSSYTGRVVAWGRNDFGQTNVPVGLTNVIAVAGGFRHSMALNADGTVAAWGHDDFGQSTVPVDLTNVVAISAGAWHSMALRANGTIAVWGDNMYGQSDIPVGLTDVVAISGGAEHSMALRANGTVVAWGYNAHGQTTIPAGLTNVIAIAACGEHSLALKNDGTVVAWGWGGYGQTTVPAGLTNVVSIAGWHQSMALRADGTVAAWGWNSYGQSAVPVELSNGVGLAVGDFFSAALRSDGSVVAWGGNTYGETDVPSSVTNAFAIAGGGYHTLVIVPTSDDVLPPTEVPLLSLSVESAYGSPVPSIGTNLVENGTVQYCSVDSPIVNGSTQFVCIGWTGTGSVPASGTSNSVTFDVTNHSTITWNWETHVVDAQPLAVEMATWVTLLNVGDTGYYSVNVTGPYTGSRWDFDDGTLESDALSVEHAWSSTGLKTVRFVAWNDESSVTASVAVTVSAAPVSANLLLQENGGLLLSYTSQLSVGHSALQLNDGVIGSSSYWKSPSKPVGPHGFVWQFRDGSLAELDRAVIYNHTEGSTDRYSKGYRLELSSDGINYVIATNGVLLASDDAQTIDLGGVEASRVRLVITNGYSTKFWEMTEVEVYGLLVVPTGAVPPTVSIVSPLSGSTNPLPAAMAITVAADDVNGVVTQVVIYGDGAVLARDATEPYEAVWSGMTVGTHQIWAVAFDSEGLVTTSTIVNVVAEYPIINLLMPSNGGLLKAYTSQVSKTYGAGKLNDGLKGSSSYWRSKNNPSGPQGFVWEITNGTIARLEYAVIHNYGEGKKKLYSKNYRLELSTDGTNYTTVTNDVLPASEGTRTNTLSGLRARWVRLVVLDGYSTKYRELAEVEVFGSLAPDGVGGGMMVVPEDDTRPLVTKLDLQSTGVALDVDVGSVPVLYSVDFKASLTDEWVTILEDQLAMGGTESIVLPTTERVGYFRIRTRPVE